MWIYKWRSCVYDSAKWANHCSLRTPISTAFDELYANNELLQYSLYKSL